MRRRVPFWLLVLSFLSLWGCSKYKVASFVMPTWDTQLSAALFNRAYTLNEILAKDTALVSNGDTTFIRGVGSSNVFTLFKTQSINGVTIGDNLKISSVPQTNVAQSPSDFAINDPPPTHYALTDPALPVGITAPIPAIPQQTQSLTPDFPFSEFRSATISGGTLLVTVRNKYPATLTFSNGIDVVDASGKLIFNIPIPGDSLAPNQKDTVNKPMAGVVLTTNTPSISFKFSSPGSTTPATFESDSVISVSFTLAGIRVSAADAIVPAQPDIVIDKSIVLVDSNRVSTAAIQSGTLSLTVKNQFNLTLPVNLVINSLRDQSNAPLTIQFTLNPAGTSGSTFQQNYSLSNYTLDMADAKGNPSDSLSYTVTASLPGSNGQFVNVSTADSIQASFDLSNLQLSSFSGVVHLANPISIATDTQSVNLGDFGSKFAGAVRFSDSTKLMLNINMTGGFPSLAHLSLIPKSSTSNSAFQDSAVIEQMIYPNQPNYVTVGQQFVNVLNSYSAATNTLPDRFIINGYVIVNPTYVQGSVKSTDMVTGIGTITMPFDLGITNAVFTDTTNTPVVKDSSTSSRLDNVDSGKVVFEINNGLPIGMSFIAQLIDTLTHQVVMTLPTDSIVISAATDFNSDGTVRTPMFSRNEFTLTHDQAVELGRSYMKFNFRVATSPGQQTVMFTKSNTISLKVYANLAFTVDKNLVSK